MYEIFIQGYGKPSVRWHEIMKLYHLYKNSEHGLPKEVKDFFGYAGEPNENGLGDNVINIPYRKTKSVSRIGYIISVKDIPEGVEKILIVP